jgi:hypothetical protein
MNAQEFFELYLAMRAHFNTKSYDFVKYLGKLKSVGRVTTRTDRYWFEKVAARLNTKHEAIGFLLSNFFKQKSFWIGDPEAFQVYESWQSRNGNLGYTVSEDLSNLNETMYNKGVDFDKLIEVKPLSHPALIRLYTSGTITPETASMLMIGLKIDQRWLQTHLSKDVLVSQELERLRKYSLFLDLPILLKQHEEAIISLFKQHKSNTGESH